jgi:plastocyanin
VRLRKHYLLPVALLGAAVAVVPTIASSSTSASITAVDLGAYGYEHAWEAKGVYPAEVGIKPSDAVLFSYPTGTSYHFPLFKTGPATPTCESLPHMASEAGPGWSGSCTFTAEGTYEFWCGVHGSAMKAFIYVNAAGTVSSTTTTTSTSTSTTTSTYTFPTSTQTTTTSTQTQPPPSTTISTQPPGGTTATTAHTTTTPIGETPEGALPPVLLIAGSQRGGALHGSANIPSADRGARLEVDLLATTASLARKHAKRVRIGRFVRDSVAAGKVSFSVSLNAQAKRALRRHHRLPLIVEVILAPPHGAPVTTTRSVVLHG